MLNRISVSFELVRGIYWQWNSHLTIGSSPDWGTLGQNILRRRFGEKISARFFRTTAFVKRRLGPWNVAAFGLFLVVSLLAAAGSDFAGIFRFGNLARYKSFFMPYFLALIRLGLTWTRARGRSGLWIEKMYRKQLNFMNSLVVNYLN